MQTSLLLPPVLPPFKPKTRVYTLKMAEMGWSAVFSRLPMLLKNLLSLPFTTSFYLMDRGELLDLTCGSLDLGSRSMVSLIFLEFYVHHTPSCLHPWWPLSFTKSFKTTSLLLPCSSWVNLGLENVGTFPHHHTKSWQQRCDSMWLLELVIFHTVCTALLGKATAGNRNNGHTKKHQFDSKREFSLHVKIVRMQK
jgi:hypothetical protein